LPARTRGAGGLKLGHAGTQRKSIGSQRCDDRFDFSLGYIFTGKGNLFHDSMIQKKPGT